MRRAFGQPHFICAGNESLTIWLLNNKVKLTKKEARPAAPELRLLPKPEGVEQEKWLESLESVLEFALKNQEPEDATRFLDKMAKRLRKQGAGGPRVVSTPYLNTIPAGQEAPFPGRWEMERQIKSYIRWNAIAMAVTPNPHHHGLSDHISTY